MPSAHIRSSFFFVTSCLRGEISRLPMSRTRALVFFAISILAVIAAGAGLRYTRSLCEEETVSEISNGTYVAVVFRRDCGGPDSVHVNLRKEGSSFGTDFLQGTIHEGEVLSASIVSHPIDARWTGPTSLTISLPADSVYPSRYAPRNTGNRTRIVHMDQKWGEVSITYERQP